MISYDMTKTPVVNVVDDILAYGATHGASDIHFDPREDSLMVRMRVDGDLRDYTNIQKIYERNLITRIKLLANMNITESRLPQDGAIKGTIKGIPMETRVSTLPTNEGEKCVIRILDYSRSLAGIDSLGFNERNLEKLKKMIKEPNGIILITGATGSGKSTTVYSILQVLNNKETNIITVEDPIEMNLEGLNQVQVNSEIGLDFATVLRSILRQDPNVILIGEIRDSETAKIAVRASITGHLVLSTVHTNNSLSTIERLLDMNVERYLLSSALTGIISQRLAKMLCTHCRKKEATTPYQKKIFKLALHKDVEETYVANHDGCEYCSGGYHDRVAIQEVLLINDEIRNSSINNVVLESIQNGTLTVFGVRGWPNVFKFPVNAFLGYPMMNSKKLKDYKIDFEEKFNSLQKIGNVEYFVGLHSVKWIDEGTLIEISNFLNRNKETKLSLHICETIEEVDYIKKKYGMTPIELLNKYKLLNENTLLVHCNYLDDDDVKLLQDNKVSVVACHSSNLKLKNKPCNVKKLLDNKINVMIATDGPATNDSLSLLDSLRVTALLTNLNSCELLDMITVNPARYMKINSGSIDEGNKADILFYNRNSLNLTYNRSIIENLIYTSGNKPEIVIKDGKVIIKNYCFESKIEYDIIQEKNRIIKLLENDNVF